MRIIRPFFTVLFLLLCVGTVFSLASRQVHYVPTPDGTGVMCVNGTSKFNRGLYGAHSGFRVDCSDIPEFGIYLPKMGGNLRLFLPDDSCIATYVPGKMIYRQGGITVEIQVGRTSDVALWEVSNTNSKPTSVGIRFGGVADKKFSREGDLGVDPPDCFDLKPAYCIGNTYDVNGNVVTVGYGVKERKTLSLVLPTDSHQITPFPFFEGEMELKPGETRIIAMFPSNAVPMASDKDLRNLFEQVENERKSLASSISLSTPDVWLNPIGGALAVAADGIWGGEAWLHGSIGWRSPHLGWRGAYVGDALGWYDRALTHFHTYAANQITDIPAVLDHPCQDIALNMARAEKRWGTPMYSNGYICRRPGKKDEMSHYDMNMVYADALLRHFRHTADTTVMCELFPVIKRHLEWEKRNFDPDGDHLYDAYCCIWASDALYYSGGSVTHSSAYNMLANSIAADVAKAIGEDPTPYRNEAEAIRSAIDSVLWMDGRGHWAEFKDYGEGGRLHPAAALWTIYHAIDSEVADPFCNYAATVYIDRNIPHIPVTDSLFTLSTTNWKPYSWSINNVAIAEVMHTALAYWQAGRRDDAFRLMKATVMDNMYMGASPLNFGQISQFDAARGECYRDFADAIGVWGRALTEGLYGIRPNRIGEDPRVDIIPGFPSEWNEASIDLPDMAYTFKREGNMDLYTINNRYPAGTILRLKVPASGLDGVEIDGAHLPQINVALSIGEPLISIDITKHGVSMVRIRRGKEFKAVPTGKTCRKGPVLFTEMTAGLLLWWKPYVGEYPKLVKQLPDDFTDIKADKCELVKLGNVYNACVTDIFRNSYLSPRPNVTTLQMPTQGMGDWCHPKNVAVIDDSGLRSILAMSGDTLTTSLGISFTLPAEGKNILFTTLWDNYPDSVSIPIQGYASHIYLLMAGSTNHMQWGMDNGMLRASYADGSSTVLPIVNPLNWTPIEQDFFTDAYAFAQPGGNAPPYRLNFADGRVSRNLLDDIVGCSAPIDRGMELGVVDGRKIPGGAGILVDMPVDKTKQLVSLSLKTMSHDVVIGIMAITLQRL